ncbi:MAG: DUF4199 domain-containing protein [Bacteroidetes bacterium]|nr:DUF4199 domain-containing protein [Bacteroidota bacterium]
MSTSESAPLPAKVSMIPVALRYGLIGILLSIVFSMILYLFDQHYNLFLGMAGLIFPILVIFFGIHAFKYNNGKQITFKQALSVGMLITLIYAVGAFIFTQIFINLIVDNYWGGMEDAMETMMERIGAPDEQIEKSIEKMQKRKSIGHQLQGTLTSFGVIGFLSSLIAGAIYNTSKEKDDNLL